MFSRKISAQLGSWTPYMAPTKSSKRGSPNSTAGATKNTATARPRSRRARQTPRCTRLLVKSSRGGRRTGRGRERTSRGCSPEHSFVSYFADIQITFTRTRLSAAPPTLPRRSQTSLPCPRISAGARRRSDEPSRPPRRRSGSQEVPTWRLRRAASSLRQSRSSHCTCRTGGPIYASPVSGSGQQERSPSARSKPGPFRSFAPIFRIDDGCRAGQRCQLAVPRRRRGRSRLRWRGRDRKA